MHEVNRKREGVQRGGHECQRGQPDTFYAGVWERMTRFYEVVKQELIGGMEKR